jgi:hypothetical protein
MITTGKGLSSGQAHLPGSGLDEKMALQSNTSAYNKTLEPWESARAISENQPVHFPGQGNCSSKAHENLQRLSNN